MNFKKLILLLGIGTSGYAATSPVGLAPEITDLSAGDVSYALEAILPDLETPYITTSPAPRMDGIQVGTLAEGKEEILAYAREITEGFHGQIDSLLVSHKGRLLFESYYRRGRANYPHYQMSITKSYTAMAIGRAIQLGHLTMADLSRPVVDFLTDIDRNNLAPGASSITLTEALNMRSGIRIKSGISEKLMRKPDALKGLQQIQAYLNQSAPIPPSPREFKYQSSDPTITMQVLEAAVPGTARAFIKDELLGKMGITNFAWQDDVSGLPKSAAGSSMRSRDMLKLGLLVMKGGQWQDQQLLPESFVEKATSRIHTNRQGTSYGYFWWRHAAEVGARKFDCISGRGAGGQFILIFPEAELVIVLTAHNKGMGNTLATAPARILPSFVKP